MAYYLIKNINREHFDSFYLSTLLIHIYDSKITTATQLFDSLLQKYLDIDNSNGLLYCISHYTYKLDGDNVYKLGRAKDIDKRLGNYITYYIKPVTLEYNSPSIPYHDIAESILFDKLREFRVVPNREFFDCQLDIIKKSIDDITQEFKTSKIVDIVKKYKTSSPKIIDTIRSIVRMINKFPKLKNIIELNINKYDYIPQLAKEYTEYDQKIALEYVDSIIQNEVFNKTQYPQCEQEFKDIDDRFRFIISKKDNEILNTTNLPFEIFNNDELVKFKKLLIDDKEFSTCYNIKYFLMSNDEFDNRRTSNGDNEFQQNIRASNINKVYLYKQLSQFIDDNTEMTDNHKLLLIKTFQIRQMAFNKEKVKRTARTQLFDNLFRINCDKRKRKNGKQTRVREEYIDNNVLLFYLKIIGLGDINNLDIVDVIYSDSVLVIKDMIRNK